MEYDHANGNMAVICIISLELIWIPIYRTSGQSRLHGFWAPNIVHNACLNIML